MNRTVVVLVAFVLMLLTGQLPTSGYSAGQVFSLGLLLLVRLYCTARLLEETWGLFRRPARADSS